MANIGIVDADLIDKGTRHPNLALMKIAGYYLEQGDNVELIYHDYDEVKKFDKVFISKVFSFTNVPEWVLNYSNVEYGGTGFYEDGGENLPDEIEHHMPYYDLYREYVNLQISLGHQRSRYSDYLDYSIGFTSRGCFRKCSFCVNKKYDHAFLHSPVQEFYDGNRPYIYLWDDNILALPQWEQVLDNIESVGKPFQFRQGIDLRLMTNKKAERFVNAHYHGDFIFAFDHLEEKQLIVEKVQLWKRYSAKICKMYVISAYKSQDETDIADVFERIKTLMRYGSLPYIMRYEAYKTSPFKTLYIELARWCNQPNFFKKKSFREFCIANQEYKKNKDTYCSAYKAMTEFEEKFPDIAKKYYDLRFDNESMYIKQYGYGRKYANKPLCKDCKKAGACWDDLINNTCQADELLLAYFTKEIDFECLRYKNAECKMSPSDVLKAFVTLLLQTSNSHIVDLIKGSTKREKITKENIPQYSKLKDAYINVPAILKGSGETLSFSKMGYYLTRYDKSAKQNDVANKKYGENHAKVAALLDLVTIDKTSNSAQISLSEFGKYYCTLQESLQSKLVVKLCLRIPIVQLFFIEGSKKKAIDDGLNVLATETKKRRRSNVINVIKLITKDDCLQ